MKEIKSLSPVDCQIILNNILQSKDNEAFLFFDYILIDEEIKGFVYKIGSETSSDKFLSMYLNEPDVIIELYRLDYNITNLLKNLMLDYLDMNELNYTFFDHINIVGDILHNKKLSDSEKIKNIIDLRKNLADKI